MPLRTLGDLLYVFPLLSVIAPIALTPEVTNSNAPQMLLPAVIGDIVGAANEVTPPATTLAFGVMTLCTGVIAIQHTRGQDVAVFVCGRKLCVKVATP